MLSFLRSAFFLLLSLPLTDLAAPADIKAQPVPVAAPAFLDVITFQVHTDGENHKMIVTTSPTLLRVDEADDGYSVIYNPQTDHYTGLEHRNYTFWDFSWTEVRDAVQSSKRYETRLQELNLDGINGDASAPAPTPTPSASIPDDSGYVWRPTADRKKIAGLDCIRWTGDTVSGESVEAWCFPGSLPKVRGAMEQLRKINEPMALVPVRTLVPPLIFSVYDGLSKGGVTPVLIIWGGDQDKNHFGLIETKTREYDARLFTVPKDYIKTTLVTMDGMLDQKK